ncbi:AraC family transcriptional regulator [Paenibacillus oceani]|uniref:AraC family transcriptional regulator n=1 Tax=Paenibacillus oceani TaxID=2772510 RepID=A0A927GYQ5_9BACL|nr:AraC family transcriptional regulator [Paenibacillus oceani]MBD2861438.1 AraC family transcriptional regulator [Paenibacillus oceani]
MSVPQGAKMTSIPGKRRFQFDCLHLPEPMRYGPLLLQQIGDLSCDANFVLSNHQQVCYEISYVVSGKGWFATDDHRFDLEQGDIYIGNPGEYHQGGSDPDEPFRYLYLGFHFNPALPADHPFLDIKKRMDNKATPRCRDRLDIRTPFVNVLKEMCGTNRFSESMIQMYLEQILILTYRNFFSDWDAKYPGEGGENAAKRAVYAAIHYIDDRLLQIEDLKEISDAFGYSLSYLSHLFSRETGDCLRDYVVKKKWRKAVELMKTGEYSITEIAAIMRYDSIHTFSRAFRKAFGYSPTQYIREHLKPPSGAGAARSNNAVF